MGGRTEQSLLKGRSPNGLKTAKTHMEKIAHHPWSQKKYKSNHIKILPHSC
jgi:hypothetical protein